MNFVRYFSRRHLSLASPRIFIVHLSPRGYCACAHAHKKAIPVRMAFSVYALTLVDHAAVMTTTPILIPSTTPSDVTEAMAGSLLFHASLREDSTAKRTLSPMGRE